MKYFLIVGEFLGDNLGGLLMEGLRLLDREVVFLGVGGLVMFV